VLIPRLLALGLRFLRFETPPFDALLRPPHISVTNQLDDAHQNGALILCKTMTLVYRLNSFARRRYEQIR